jgi:hypothetical protein
VDSIVISTSWDASRVTREERVVGGKTGLLGEMRCVVFDGDSAFLRLVGVSGTSISSMSTSDSTWSEVVVEINLRFCGESLDGSALSGVFVGDLRGVAVALVGDDRFVLFSSWIRALRDEQVLPILFTSLVNDF